MIAWIVGRKPKAATAVVIGHGLPRNTETPAAKQTTAKMRQMLKWVTRRPVFSDEIPVAVSNSTKLDLDFPGGLYGWIASAIGFTNSFVGNRFIGKDR